MRIRTDRWLLLGVGLALSTGVALAQVSTNFNLQWWSLSGSGGARQSANYLIDTDLGYIGGVSVSTNQRVEVGIAGGTANSGPGNRSLYLPLVSSSPD